MRGLLGKMCEVGGLQKVVFVAYFNAQQRFFQEETDISFSF